MCFFVQTFLWLEGRGVLMMKSRILTLGFCAMLFLSLGCQAQFAFPKYCRAGDTISVFVGTGSGKTWKTSNVTLDMYPSGNPSTLYYPTLRSIFYARPDPTSKVVNYQPDPMIDGITNGDIYQAVAVVDTVPGTPAGAYILRFSDTDGAVASFALNIVDGVGQKDQFINILGTNSNITQLELAPQKGIAFDSGFTIGAVDLTLDFDDSIATTDINVITAMINRGAGTFQNYQRMFYWKNDVITPSNKVLKISIICPAGVDSDYLRFQIVYPEGVVNPGLSIISSKVVDVNGSPISGVTAFVTE